ncbi:Fungal specific transcription factor domain-containing protein isoform 1 [Cladophialophora immunda]|nr:Fungal specific transcription factor domain-containing protein isoform 1 [Cladophialophora immunda]
MDRSCSQLPHLKQPGRDQIPSGSFTAAAADTLTDFEGNMSDVAASIETETLEDIECTPDLFHQLLDDFWTHFHPRVPFFTSKESLTSDCVTCPLLFWAIVGVAARLQEGHRALYLSLPWPIRRLAMEQSITVLPTVPLIQGLLLLCLWPLPYGAMIDDPGAIFCSIATQKAMQIGLHRPQKPSDFIWCLKPEPEMSTTRARIWGLCFVINKAISASIGVPMLVRPDHTIISLQKQASEEIDPILRDLVTLAHRQYIISQLLGNDDRAPDGIRSSPLALLDALELSLSSLESSLTETPSGHIRRQYIFVKLVIYVFVFSMNEEERKASMDAASYTSKAYLSACEIIRTSVTDQENVRLWTRLDHESILMAVLVLHFILRQYPSASNQVESRDCIQKAWTMLKMLSDVEGDHFNRICSVIDWMSNSDWTADLTVLADTSELLVRSRMESNIVYDVITRAKARYLMGKEQRRQEQLPDHKPRDSGSHGILRSSRPPCSTPAGSETIDLSTTSDLTPNLEPSSFAVLDQMLFQWEQNPSGLFSDYTYGV